MFIIMGLLEQDKRYSQLSPPARSGMELTAAHMVLCFGFVPKILLIIHLCFGYCSIVAKHHVTALFFHSVPSARRLWEHAHIGRHDWERTQLGQLTQTGPRDTQYHITSYCNAINWARGRRRGQIGYQGGLFSETRWVWICLWEVVSDCFCITFFFFFPLSPTFFSLFLSLPTSLIAVGLPGLSGVLMGVSNLLCGCTPYSCYLRLLMHCLRGLKE